MNENKQLPQSPEEFTHRSNEFCAALEDPACWASVPLLNCTSLHELPDMTVVRFRGMIQDMQDPEIYLERYEVKSHEEGSCRLQDGKYRDCLVLHKGEEVNYESGKNIQGERRTLFVVSIPGLNHWASAYEANCNTDNLPKSESCSAGVSKKRAAINMEVDADDNDNLPKSSVEVSNKRPANNHINLDTVMEAEDSNKRQCIKTAVSNISASNQMLGSSYLLNSPIPDRPSKACLVKIYSDFDAYTLNSVVDVVGFLSVDPMLDVSTINDDAMTNDYDNINELQALNPPPSLIPRLHAIAVNKPKHTNPLLDVRIRLKTTDNMSEAENQFNMLSVRKELHVLLSLCLFNDELAADYLLSHLISTVYNRSDFESIGKFALNICNIPKEVLPNYTNKLYEILELIVPVSHFLPMTLDNMNTTSFDPKKDYETSKLVSGILQLAPQTHLVLDETQMHPGKLEPNGVKAIQSLANLINKQQIKCNFLYYEIDYDVDIPVLVLSEGKSMLPNDFLLPLRSDEKGIQIITETFKAAQHYLHPARLDQIRRFLTKAKTSQFTMKPEDSEMIQNDFVEMRKANIITDAYGLHALLVLSRLLAISQGKNVLDMESWKLAKDMEAERRQRVQELPKSIVLKF